MAKDSDELLSQGKKAYIQCSDAEQDNRLVSLDDIRFSRLNEQWPDDIKKQRELERRPCLTINKMPAFIRQVVNDARQNRPSIKVHPVDSGADPYTAEIINGLIRNIEYTSNADVAYDTAIEQSVSGGLGYWRVGVDYAYDDSFDLDITIERIANQFSVYGDPFSTAADSSDWMQAFVVERMSKDAYKAKYKGAKNIDGEPVTVDFDNEAWSEADSWIEDDAVYVAEWWRRKEVTKTIAKLSNGQVYAVEELESDPDLSVLLEAGALQIVAKRETKSYEVEQITMSGADIIERRDWPGCFIPIVPVYGDEIWVEGKRYFRSLIHNAIDAQRMVNYWRTTATELTALAPKVPFIGRKGTFDSDVERWATANTVSHAYIEYDTEAPIRMPLDSGVAAGALQEALNASDDMKAIIGLYDASLGARSNETSGKAIMARQREGDVATFHFIDNLSRAIRHTGRILIDLIPKIYTGERIVRVIGEDGSPRNVTVNGQQPQPVMGPDGQPKQDQLGQAIMAIHDLSAGKYDLTVSTGPSFTSQREEAAMQMIELIRAYPDAAPVIGDLLAKNLDWPGADEIAERLKKINPALRAEAQIPPQVQQQIAQGMEQMKKLQDENTNLKADLSTEMQKIELQHQAKLREQDLDYQAKLRQIAIDREVEMVKAGLQAMPQMSAENPARQG